MAQRLPFTSEFPFYDFSVVLEGATYQFDVKWNQRDGAWYFDLLDEEGNAIRHGVKIVLGAALAGRVAADDRLPGLLQAFDTSGASTDAGIDDLGSRVVVVYYTAAEVAAGESLDG